MATGGQVPPSGGRRQRGSDGAEDDGITRVVQTESHRVLMGTACEQDSSEAGRTGAYRTDCSD